MIGIALAGWDRVGWGARFALVDHWMRMRDRRGPIAVVVLAAAYLTLVATALSWLGHAATATPMIKPGVPEMLLAANGALLVWRLAMRVGFTSAAYGWRGGLWAIPRAFVGNVIALLAARRAMLRYVAMLRGAPLAWDKTAHVFPTSGPGSGA
jgi:adsorption protein B